jgi:methylthioribulose-1-phosphate dehydratase
MSDIPTTAAAYDGARLQALAGEIIVNVRELAAAGMTPATSSNFSRRLGPTHAAITVSGRDKGHLVESDVMVVDLDGAAVGSDHRPSAETLLHTQLYRRFPEIGCVLHTHSRVQTVASRLYSGAGQVRLEGYELLKAFSGNDTHDTYVDLPVLSNSQDMRTLAAQVDALLDRQCMWGYLIDGHGLYTWGRDMAEARRHLDAFEFLLGCELELRRIR